MATTPELRDLAFRIRYQAYRNGDYIQPLDDERFCDEYDNLDTSRTFVLFKDDQPAGTARICFQANEDDSLITLPAMEVFREEIKAMQDRPEFCGRKPRLIEMNKLARLPDYNSDMNIAFAMFRMGAYMHVHTATDIFLYAVRNNHVPMYRRMGFQQITSARPYKGLSFTTCLMASFPENHDALINRQPFMRGVCPNDIVCQGLVAGERVSIFGNDSQIITNTNEDIKRFQDRMVA